MYSCRKSQVITHSFDEFLCDPSRPKRACRSSIGGSVSLIVYASSEEEGCVEEKSPICHMAPPNIMVPEG